jgi:hypothetical protein
MDSCFLFFQFPFAFCRRFICGKIQSSNFSIPPPPPLDGNDKRGRRHVSARELVSPIHFRNQLIVKKISVIFNERQQVK